MALPFDNDIFVNVLREISLAAAIELAHSTQRPATDTNDPVLNYSNLNNPSIFGSLYQPHVIKSKLDVYKDFPLLSHLPVGSPPIRFEDDSNKLLSNQHNNDSYYKNPNTSYTTTSMDYSNTLTEEEEEEELQEQKGRDQTAKHIGADLVTVESEACNSIKQSAHDNHNAGITDARLVVTDSASHEKDRPPGAADSTDTCSTGNNRKNSLMIRKKPPMHKPTASVSETIKESDTESDTESKPLASPRSDQSSLLVTSVQSNDRGTTTPITRPQLGDRSASLDTFRSKSETGTPNSKQLSSLHHHLKTASVGSKKQSKGLLALGRLIRPKQLASNLVHHATSHNSNTNVNSSVGNADANSLSDLDSEHSNQMDELKIRNNDSFKSTSQDSQVEKQEFSHSRKFYLERQASDHGTSDKASLNEPQPLELSLDSDKYLSTNSERDTIDSSDFDDDRDEYTEINNNRNNNKSSNNNAYHNLTVKNIDNQVDGGRFGYAQDNNDVDSENYDDDDEDDPSDLNYGYDDKSIVDSIESSELADSDYDYFNPPVSAARSTNKSGVRLLHDGQASTNRSSFGTSASRNNSRPDKYMYHTFDEAAYMEDIDSDDYISDAEYPMDDSVAYYNDTTGSNSETVLSSVSVAALDQAEKKDNRKSTSTKSNNGFSKVNSISQISFFRNRPTLNSNTRILTTSRRRKSSSNGIRPSSSMMILPNASTVSTLPSNTLSSSSGGSMQNQRLLSVHRAKNVKSFANLMSLNMEEVEGERKQKNKERAEFEKLKLAKEKLRVKENISFDKIIPPGKKLEEASKLTELLHKADISLEYYKYVSERQNESEMMMGVNISVPKLGVPYENLLKININSSVQVVELIGYVLYMISEKWKHDKSIKIEDKYQDKLDPNYWKVYLADDDGEIEDDFGVLDRTRTVESYGTDEFVVVECSEEERKQNEKLTPSPLKKNGDTNVISNTKPIQIDSVNEVSMNMIKEGSLATLPSDLTPTSVMPFNNTLPSNINHLQSKPPVPAKVGVKRFVMDDLDSDDDEDDEDDEDEIFTESKRGGKDTKKYTYIKARINSNRMNEGLEKEKESKLNKFKTRSKTIQSILHNTADHYQLTQQELFRADLNNNMINNSSVNNGNMVDDDSGVRSGHEHRMKMIRKGLNKSNNGLNEGRRSNFGGYELQQQLHNNMVNGAMDEESDNKALMYHRWTVWRRQQMSFKSKLPKTLTVDGYQIYLLPFNEFKGSWYDSKTYNFDISQILKIKQNEKVPSYFKIIIKKNAEGIVKKYYLEAESPKECAKIVNTIRALAKTYSEQM